MFHLCAFFKALANVANTDCPAVSDDILTIQNNHFLMPQDLDVLAAYASAVTLTQARINSPTVRQINPDYIRPFSAALLPVSNPPVKKYPPGILRLNAQEEVQIEATDSAAGPNNFYALLWLTTGITPAPVGDIHWCRFTSTTTHVASAWTTIAYTLETGLPPGEYAMIASECINTTGIAHRWIFDNQFWRPGFLSQAALASRIDEAAYQYKYGDMGHFRTYSLPRLQVLSNAADTAAEGYMAVVRIGG